MDYQEIDKEKLKDWFRIFAERECKEVSSLYYDLSIKIAEDDELIGIASFCQERQPMPNLFLASVHYLLLTNKSEELSNYYPSIIKNYKADLPFELFKEFCIRHKKEIIELEKTKLVQTNALNRCAYIMPILSNIFDGKTINIIDIGTSAGLTLNFDKYEYHYNDKYLFGNSPVKIRSEIKNGIMPSFKESVIINKKIGVDQNPLDLKDEENVNWLKALIWGDLTERVKKINEAINVAKKESISFEKANTIQDFEEIIGRQESEIPLIIYHTHVLYQFTQEEREEFWNLIDKIGEERDLTYLATEGSRVFKTDYGLSGILVELTKYEKGLKHSRVVAETNGHGNWIKWKN